MSLYFVKTPKLITSFYKKYTWRVQTNKKEIYLTFDDGPTPKVTEFVLDTLKQFDAKATFFCIGKNIKNNSKLFNRIIEENHAIGNHTNNHLNGWKTKTDDYLQNVEKCAGIINNEELVTNNQSLKINSKLFRPPYGKIKKSQASKLIDKDYKIIMWSVLSGDFDKTITKEKCLKNVLNKSRKGSIIVFHDSEKAYEKLQYTLPKTLKYFSEKGFCFSSLD
jgi:peptidoglycan/xylan/chitin deacetylase (PgdA/CDA1 family)